MMLDQVMEALRYANLMIQLPFHAMTFLVIMAMVYILKVTATNVFANATMASKMKFVVVKDWFLILPLMFVIFPLM